MSRIYLSVLCSFLVYITACNPSSPPVDESVAESEGKAYDTVAFNIKAEKIDAFFHKLYNNYGFNGTVLVSQDEHVLYKKAFGYADVRRKKDSLKIDDIFQLASVSKQFTAAAILKLMENKKLSLDDNIQKFYPNFPYENITIRLLLHHRSGLGNYTYFSEDYCDRRTPINNQDVVQMMTEKKPGIYFRPDRVFDYSNTGYALLAAIVEKVSGKSFKDFVEKELFAKAGLKNTFVYDIHNPNEFEYIRGHTAQNRKTNESYLDGVSGDKGIYSTVEDLYKWDLALYTERILKKSTIDSAYVSGSKHLKGPFNYGFGWRTYTFKDGKQLIYHGGWWNGYKTFFFRDINHHNAIIILTNRENSGFRNLDGLYDILYDRKPSTLRQFSAYLHHSPGF